MKSVYFKVSIVFFLCIIFNSAEAQWYTDFCNSAKFLWCDEPVWGEINSQSVNQLKTYRLYSDHTHTHYTEFTTAKEKIYKFTPTKDGIHHFDLGYDSHNGHNNLDLFILKSCSNSTYHVPVAHTKALSNWSPTDQDTVSVKLQKGWTYYVVVEQMSSYSHYSTTKFNLKVKCGVPDKKNLCSSYINHLKCNTQEWNYLCTNCNNRWDEYCHHYKGYTGPEAVYTFKPEVTGEYVFDLTYNTHYGNIDMFLFSDCNMEHCVGNTADYNNWYKVDKDHLKVHLYAWQTYYIVLDRKSGSVNTFDLTVDCRIINCDKQPWLKEGYRVSDEVCKPCGDRWNGYCDWASTSHSGYEQVFRFKPKEDGNYLFDLDYWGGDMDLIILDECDPDECLSRSSHTNGIHDDELFIELKKNRTYIVVVDQKYPSNSVEFQLQVDYKGYCEQVTVKDFPQIPFFIDEDEHYTFDLYDLKSRSDFDGAYEISMSIDGKSIGKGTKLSTNVVEGRESKFCLEWKKTIGRQDYCYSYCQEIYFPIHPTVCNSLEFIYDKSSSSPTTAYTEEEALMWVMHDDSKIMEVQRAGDIDFDAHTFKMPSEYHNQGSISVSMLYKDYLGRLRICSKTICDDDFTDNGSTINARFLGKGFKAGHETLRYQLSSNIQERTTVLKWSWFPVDAGITGYNVTVSSDKNAIMEIPTDAGSNYGVSLLYKTGDCYFLKYLEVSANDPFDVCALDAASTCNSEEIFVSTNGADCGSSEDWEASIGLPSPLSQSNILYWTDHNGNIISESRTNSITLDKRYPIIYCHIRQATGNEYVINAYAIVFPSCAENLACGQEIQSSLEFESNDWNRNSLGLDESCVKGCQFNGVDKLYQFQYGGENLKISMTQMPANENISLFVLNESFQAISIDAGNGVICKGWNVDSEGNSASGSNVVGEIFADESNSLPSGTYYILIEGGCGNGASTSFTSDFSISLDCEALSDDPVDTMAVDTMTTDTIVSDSMTVDTMVSDTSVMDTTTTTAQSVCDNFDQYEDEIGISSINSRWGQTGSNDIKMFYGKVNGEEMRALQLINNSAARYNLPYEQVLGLSFELWQLSGTTNDEGIYIKLTDVDDRDVFIKIHTEGEYSYLAIDGDLPNKTSLSFSPQLNTRVDLKIEWNDQGFSVDLGSGTNFLNTGYTSEGIQSIEFKSGDDVGIANLIDNFCMDTSASVSRSSLNRSAKEVIHSYSSEESILSNQIDVNVIPNPVMVEATMVIHTLDAQKVDVNLYSITGSLLASFSENLQEGQNLISLPMSELANYEGLILYQAQTKTEKFRGKFIKLR